MLPKLKPWSNLAKENWRSREDATIIVSYPKSGRTWHRAALGLYLSKSYGLDERLALDTRLMTLGAKIPTATYTHNGANFLSDTYPQHFTNANGLIWHNKNVLLLVREPRAVLVSSYHHMKSRTKRFDGTLSEFIRHPYRGIEKILVAYNRWEKLSKKCSAFMLQSYEEMHEDHATALRGALSFLGINNIDETAISYAIENTRFEKLKKREKDGFFDHRALDNRSGSPSGNKVRKGSIDGYLNELSEADLSFIREVTDQIGNPYSSITSAKTKPT